MNGEDLYNEIKDALSYFGLKFSEKHLMTVTCSEGHLSFWYGKRLLSVPVKNSDDKQTEA